MIRGLFITAAAAVVAVGVLSVLLFAGDGPERAGTAAGPEIRLSPTEPPAATRAEGPSHCLVGSWVVTSEVVVFAFYNDSPEQPFTMSGQRSYVFRPDGTVTNASASVLTATYRGNELRVELSGTREMTWSLSGGQITYGAITSTTQVTKHYDQRGLIATVPEQPNPNLAEVDDLTCAGTQVVESNAKGYRSTWTRTADYGVYG